MANIGKQSRITSDIGPTDALPSAGRSVGKSTLVDALAPPLVQRKAERDAPTTTPAVHELAAAGVRGAGESLPFREQIQASFGPAHDVSAIRAHVGGAAAEAAGQLGATAYATGNHVAFRGTPDLHTAAHEAAHVIQQRGGVQLKGGVGATGDSHERHADAVADRVVRGDSATDLLSSYTGGGALAALQLKGDVTSAAPAPQPPVAKPAAKGAAARELAANERVLSTDPSFADPDLVAFFQDRVKVQLEAWGLAHDPNSVSFANLTLDAKTTAAIIITWNPSWGTAPMTRDFPPTMSPLDARLSIVASHELQGWSHLSAKDQVLIENLLGGEENFLSKTARVRLRRTFNSLKAKKPLEQASVLRDLIHVGKGTLSNEPEPMDTVIATVALAGPVEKKNFAFRSTRADAEEWVANFSDDVSIRIVAPKVFAPGYHNHSVQDLVDAATFVPRLERARIKCIVIDPSENADDKTLAVLRKRPNFHTYMTCGSEGILTVYSDKNEAPLPDEQARRSSIVHESSHAWSLKKWGYDTTQGRWREWKRAMMQDQVSVSGYAMTNVLEDVAETIRLYVTTRDTPRFKEYEAIVPHRFAILKSEYDK